MAQWCTIGFQPDYTQSSKQVVKLYAMNIEQYLQSGIMEISECHTLRPAKRAKSKFSYKTEV